MIFRSLAVAAGALTSLLVSNIAIAIAKQTEEKMMVKPNRLMKLWID